MEKIKTSLLLNYFRQNGRNFKVTTPGDGTSAINTGQIYAYLENLVPGSSGSNNDVLNSLANTIYLEARRHNMSLAPFGHFDPLKFVIAGLFPVLIMAEIYKQLGACCYFEFENKNYGAALAAAVNIDLTDCLDNYANYVARFNKLVARINALYVPTLDILHRWLPHRLTVYKDDDGERFSLYHYNLANYYELIVDPNSPIAGQLVYRRFFTPSDGCSTIGWELDLVAGLVDRYMDDDDFVQFVTEAQNAKLPTLQLAPIPVDGNEFAKVPLTLKYDLDDILGLENACFAYPVSSENNWSHDFCSWDVIEDIERNRLTLGRTPSQRGVLPTFVGNNGIFAGAGVLSDQNLSRRPIYTHAKISSDVGINTLMRYVIGYGRQESSPIATYHAPVTMYCGRDKYDIGSMGATGILWIPIEAAGTEILETCLVYSEYSREYENSQLNLYSNPIANSSAKYYTIQRLGFIYQTDHNGWQAVVRDMVAFAGFKARMASLFYDNDGGSMMPIVADFDYIVSATMDNFQEYFGAVAWNDLCLGSGVVNFSKSSKFNNKNRKDGKKPSKPGTSTPDKQRPQRETPATQTTLNLTPGISPTA